MIARVHSLTEIRRPVRGRVTVAAVLQAVAAALSVVPMVAVVEIGRRLLEGNTEGLWPIAWLAVGLLAVRLVLYLVSGLVGHLADAELAITLRRRLADHLTVLPLRWFAGGVSAKVKTTVQDDVAALHYAVAHAQGDLAAAVTGPVVIVGYLLWADWRLALLTVAVVAGAQAIRMRLARRAAEPVGRIAAANVELSSAAVELVQGISVVKAFGAAQAPERFRAPAEAYVAANDDAQRVFIRQRSLTRATVAPATILLLVTGCGVGFAAACWTRPIDVVAFVLLAVGLFELLTPIYWRRAAVTPVSGMSMSEPADGGSPRGKAEAPNSFATVSRAPSFSSRGPTAPKRSARSPVPRSGSAWWGRSRSRPGSAGAGRCRSPTRSG
jgi:ATP-binding cassette subfamily B protein IrtA